MLSYNTRDCEQWLMCACWFRQIVTNLFTIKLLQFCETNLSWFRLVILYDDAYVRIAQFR